MGSITDYFGALSETLIAECRQAAGLSHGRDLIFSRLLRPMLPSGIRCAPGSALDVRDRKVGPFDFVISGDRYPAFGDGTAAFFPADGILGCLAVRDWSASDLTVFAELAAQVKKLERRRNAPVLCMALGFNAMPLEELSQFLESPVGAPVDALLSLGNNVIIRNSQGWYGSPERIPFVTERGAGESLKSFALFIVQMAHSFLEKPFGLTDYQHL